MASSSSSLDNNKDKVLSREAVTITESVSDKPLISQESIMDTGNSAASRGTTESSRGVGGGVCTPKEASKGVASGGTPFVGYREDIRAYDIYQITPHLPTTEAHYSRLPSALPALSDSDSDEARKSKGVLRKRKRKIPAGGRREGGKRYREGCEGGTPGEEDEDEEEGRVSSSGGLEDVTVYTSPYLEDYTNRISSTLHRLSSSSSSPKEAAGSASNGAPTPPGSNGQRRVSFSLGANAPKQQQQQQQQGDPPSSRTFQTSSNPCRIPSSSSSSSTTTSASSSTSSSSSNPPRRYEDVTSMNDDDDDDDEDDEASTVVPDDFDDETDSDIEVLVQSSESWVDLSNQPEESPDRVTPLPFGNGEEYIRLLREAQRESNHSSARVSLASSRRDTPRDSPHDSPKSPPNSPNTEMTTDPEEVALKGVYINYYNNEGDFIRVEKNTETDWIWDWSSRPDQSPPKEWRFSHPGKGVNRGASIRRVMVGKSSLFSRDVLYTLLITNVLSLLIGTGIGIWLSKRSSSGVIVTLPMN